MMCVPGTSPTRSLVIRFVGLVGILGPTRFAVEAFGDAVGKRDGSTRGMVEFVDVVYFVHSHAVLAEAVHNLRQVAVKREEDINADAEI